MSTRLDPAVHRHRLLAKSFVTLSALILLAAPALPRAEGDRTTFGAKKGAPSRKSRPAWLQTERPTPAAKRRLKRFARMIQRHLEVKEGNLALDLDPEALDKLGIPHRALGLCTRYVKSANALKAQGYVQFEKTRAGTRVAATKKLETKLNAVTAATLQGAGKNDFSREDAWCGHKLTLWLNHANTDELLDTLEDTEDVMTLVTALCALVPGLQECAPAVAVATAVLGVGGTFIENADQGNGVKITVHTTPWYATLWADVDPQEEDDGWWPPW